MPSKRKIASPQPPKRSSRKLSKAKGRSSRDTSAKKAYYLKASRLPS